MALEDGAVLGTLLGLLKASSNDEIRWREDIPQILRLFESLRKSRTTVNVQGAVANQRWYHLVDGPLQEARDKALAAVNWKDATEWNFTDPGYQFAMLGFDSVGESAKEFQKWLREKRQGEEKLQAAAPEQRTFQNPKAVL